MIHTLLGMVTPQAWAVGIVVLFTVAAVLYFGGKAKLQKTADNEVVTDLNAKEQQARWSNVFDDIEEYRHDFPDVS